MCSKMSPWEHLNGVENETVSVVKKGSCRSTLRNDWIARAQRASWRICSEKPADASHGRDRYPRSSSHVSSPSGGWRKPRERIREKGRQGSGCLRVSARWRLRLTTLSGEFWASAPKVGQASNDSPTPTRQLSSPALSAHSGDELKGSGVARLIWHPLGFAPTDSHVPLQGHRAGHVIGRAHRGRRAAGGEDLLGPAGAGDVPVRQQRHRGADVGSAPDHGFFARGR